MRIALDTNRYTDLCRGSREVIRVLEDAEAVFLPFAVLAELRAGFAVGRHGRANERVLQQFLSKPGVAPLFPNDDTTRTYATLYRQLRRQGTPIPTNDIWIAALVVQNDLAFYTRDEHFEHLPQLHILR
jgi:tRNA(fMet)-specific endonuclease VapC